MPPYRVDLQSSAERDLARLSGTTLDRIADKLEGLASDPRPAGSQKLAGTDAYRVRVGDHRILYEMDDPARLVTVTRIRHRREVYRKLR